DEQMAALARPDAPRDLAAALASVAGRISIAEYVELMTRLLTERAWLLARIGDEVGFRRLRNRLARAMGCDPDDTSDGLRASACLEAAFDAAGLRAAARALAKGGTKNADRADLITAWLAAGENRPALLSNYRKGFFTKEGEILKKLAT